MEHYNVELLNVEDITPSKHNPRIFKENDAELDSLKCSIAKNGLLHPIIVRKYIDTENGGNTMYEIVAGERRFRALKGLSLPVPAHVVALSDTEAIELTVTENLQREDLMPIEEANGIQSLIDTDISVKDIAEKLGKSVRWVQRRARISKLTPEWKDALSSGKESVLTYTAGNLEMIARYEPSVQALLLDHFSFDDELENVTKSDIESVVERFERILDKAPFDLKESKNHPEAGACTDCPKKSSCRSDLFEKEELEDDQCLDAECWNEKIRKHIISKVDEMTKKGHTVVFLRSHGDEEIFPEDHEYYVNSHRQWDFNEAKETDKGALISIFISGSEAGIMRWVTPDTGGSAKPTGPDGKAIPKTLEERRIRHTKRRTVAFLKQLHEKLLSEAVTLELCCKFTDEKLLQFIMVYGSNEMLIPEKDRVNEWSCHYGSMEKSKSISDILSDTRFQINQVMRHSFPKMLSELKQEMNYRANPSLGINLSKYFGYDYIAMAEQIKKDIPEPKAWAFLNEDGTLKKKDK